MKFKVSLSVYAKAGEACSLHTNIHNTYVILSASKYLLLVQTCIDVVSFIFRLNNYLFGNIGLLEKYTADVGYMDR